MKLLIVLIFLLPGCGLFSAEAVKEPVKKVSDKDKISISAKRISFAHRVCKLNGKVKEIQIKPREIIVCGNDAKFSK